MALTWGRPRGVPTPGFAEDIRASLPPAEVASGPVVTNSDISGWRPAALPTYNPQGTPYNPSAPVVPEPRRGPLSVGEIDVSLPSFDMMTTPMKAALAAKPKPKFFDKQGGWRDAVGILADALSVAGGNQASYMPLKMRRQEVERQDRKDSIVAMREQTELEERMRIARRPKLMTVPGVGVVSVDEDTLDQRTVVPIRSDGQSYADSLGYQSGTPQYVNALKDYALRGNGPTAMEGRTALQDDRQSAAVDALLRRLDQGRQIAELRDGTARRGQDIGSTDRRYSTTTASTDRRRGQDISSRDRSRAVDVGSRDRNRAIDVGSRDRRESASFNGTGGRGGPGGAGGSGGGTSGARIIDPRTKRAAIVKNGKWVDEVTGQPLS